MKTAEELKRESENRIAEKKRLRKFNRRPDDDTESQEIEEEVWNKYGLRIKL